MRPVESSATVTGGDQVRPSSEEWKYTARCFHFERSRYGLLVSMLIASRPSASLRMGLVRLAGPISSDIGMCRQAPQLAPLSKESAMRIDIGRQPSVSALNSGWPG